ncbi:MAG: prepilin-type N-terminal cleavage/methylation domain-containing protein, partial [Phycisphaeraceae bacterium]|nr:prepilin-type N-terminal cleavage/methylation domain-containing protein [Phycisphaeraceae bacterium]
MKGDATIKKNKAFTLVELLVVIAIIAVLMG